MSGHISVLLEESVNALNLGPKSVVFDCTFGAGGHTAALLKKVSPGGHVYALDRDSESLETGRNVFASEISSNQLTLKHTRFSALKGLAKSLELLGGVDAIFADIGVSSMHLDQAKRGFSFQKDGPLDMRMDQSSGETAADLVANMEETDLANVIYKYGEERFSRSIARAIVNQRQTAPITTTAELAATVASAIPRKAWGKKNPATKTFQALRIFLNKELEELEALLDDSLALLKDGGRVGIITFHSLEDRLVKQTFKTWAGQSKTHIPRDLPVIETKSQQTKGKIIKPFPINPSEEEQKSNPRSRSARLRVFEKGDLS